MRRFYAVRSRGLRAGAWGVLGNAAVKLVGGSEAGLTTTAVVAAGVGRNFIEEKPNKQITAHRASKDADMSRIFASHEVTNNPNKYYTADSGVFGCRPVETVGAPYAVVSDYQQT